MATSHTLIGQLVSRLPILKHQQDVASFYLAKTAQDRKNRKVCRMRGELSKFFPFLTMHGWYFSVKHLTRVLVLMISRYCYVSPDSMFSNFVDSHLNSYLMSTTRLHFFPLFAFPRLFWFLLSLKFGECPSELEWPQVLSIYPILCILHLCFDLSCHFHQNKLPAQQYGSVRGHLSPTPFSPSLLCLAHPPLMTSFT